MKEKTNARSSILAWSAGAALLTLPAGCSCPHITRVSSVEPSTLETATPTNVEVRFEEPVLPEDAEGDIRVLFMGASRGDFIADYRAGEDPSGIITALEVTGEDSLRFDLDIPAEHPPGSYRLRVSYNPGGECDLAGGQEQLTVE